MPVVRTEPLRIATEVAKVGVAKSCPRVEAKAAFPRFSNREIRESVETFFSVLGSDMLCQGMAAWTNSCEHL